MPVLAITGEQDIETPAATQLPALQAQLKLAGNQRVTTAVVPQKVESHGAKRVEQRAGLPGYHAVWHVGGSVEGIAGAQHAGFVAHSHFKLAAFDVGNLAVHVLV
uniref:Uncharacterized protein n=1 Tax=Tanacetum cinerariifolium TaxID=118510 RepID=A0A699SG11_TANCI|nr:hypothetical protein [Tanacetum cinerariifolium]